jgi:hypothetical protein
MRPKYETPEHRDKEQIFISRLTDKWNVNPLKLPLHYSLDYLLLQKTSNAAKAWVELKIRTNKMDVYPAYMISFYKILSAKQLSEASVLPAFLAVQWKDKAAALRIDKLENFSLTKGGRRDRNDTSDLEPVAMIPIINFDIELWEGEL